MLVLRNEALAKKNTLALKASASAYVDVSSDIEIKQALDWADQHQLQLIPLGEGSNIILAGDIRALVMRQLTGGITVLEDHPDKVVVRVAAGENWHALVQWSLAQGYYGLENLALIPGTVGAAPIQNIGAYGVELASCVHRVTAVGIEDGRDLIFSVQDCEFGYRHSIFKGHYRDKLIITALELSLSKQPNVQASYPSLRGYLNEQSIDSPEPADVFQAVVNIRQSRLPDPGEIPNAGSFFKNPLVGEQKFLQLQKNSPAIPGYAQADGMTKLAAAWLIEQCGWKGRRQGPFGVHPEHALVLVNYDGDDGEQLLHLAARIHDSVLERFGVELEIEPRVYGRHQL